MITQPYYHSTASAILINDNKVIKNMGVDTTYNGKVFNIKGYNNNENYQTKLNNEDILKILSIKAEPKSLDKRLLRDFNISLPIKHTRKKGTKSKGTKSKCKGTKSKGTKSKGTKSKGKGKAH